MDGNEIIKERKNREEDRGYTRGWGKVFKDRKVEG